MTDMESVPAGTMAPTGVSAPLPASIEKAETSTATAIGHVSEPARGVHRHREREVPAAKG